MDNAQRILVVDDEPGTCEALREILQPKYPVMMAANGPDALQAVNTSAADLVFLDLKMPGMNGLEVLQAIKGADASIEVIMMTAYATLDTLRSAMACGASGYLTKPFREKEVDEAIAQALARRAARTAGHQELHTLLAQLHTLAQPTSAPADSAPLAAVLAPVHRLLGASTTLLYRREGANAPWRAVVAISLPSGAQAALETPAWQAWLAASLAQHVTATGPGTPLPSPLTDLGYTQALVCPLALPASGVGLLVWLATTPPPWPATTRALAQTVADCLAIALTAQQHTQEAQQAAAAHTQRAAQLAIGRAISRVILGQLELPEMLQTLGTQLQGGLGYAGFHVWLATPEGSLALAASQGSNPGWQPAAVPTLPPALEVQTLSDAQVVLAPIVLADAPVGVLKLVRTAPQAPLTPAELELMRLLLDAIVLAVHNARLYGALATTGRLLDQLIEGAGDAIVTVDAADRITLWNPGAERLFGTLAAAMRGQPIQRLFPATRWAAWRETVASEGMSLQVETTVTSPGGSPREVLLTLSPLGGPARAPTGWSCICKDITAERRLRAQMLQAEKLRVLGELAAGMAHDFNNVLTTILTRAQLLQQQLEMREAMQRGLSLIGQAAADGAAIVRRLQQLARGEAVLEGQAVDLAALVRTVVESTQPVWREQTAREGRPVAVALELALVPPVWGRAAELREVLTNLLLNAVEAMPHGGRLTFRTWAQAGQVCVAVGDTGVGMTAEVQQRIFDPFFTTKGARGTGLGLTVSQALVKGHQGTLSVQSAPGRGATFVITLPTYEGAPRGQAGDVPG
jgi:PAS domain S-box-containing protein